ncbi:serine/threonine protein kinase [Sulfurihydrogenibium sp.]|uniref:serine/threonine protein kinase n=1 Tax=Sulfurihydrogenibium sp. TaxID=2053621 RepID=UPI00260B1BC7|nr:serine/threonine protein kinase [Sulfurihydrogenibium sp.]
MITFKDIKGQIENLQKIGEGWRAVVYRGKFEGKDLSFKVAISDIHKHPIQKEGVILKEINKYSIGGTLRISGEDFIAYDYIEGKPLNEILNPDNYNHLISQLLNQAFLLDKLKIDKGEMHRPYTNVLVDKNLKIHLIDFERAKKTLYPQNILNIVQFITRGQTKTDQLLNLLKDYKKNQTEENFNKIKNYLNLK